MNEVDFFIKLLDEKETDRILKMFQETPMGHSKKASIEKKKQHLKLVFNRQTPKMRRNSGKTHPFYYYLNQITKLDTNEPTSDKEFFIFMYEIRDTHPQYHRYSQALLLFPDSTKANLNKMNDNFEANKDIFDFNLEFESEQEFKSYLEKTKAFLGENTIKNALACLHQLMSPEDISTIKNLRREFKSLSFREVYEKIEDYKETHKYYLTIYAYLSLHSDKDLEFNKGLVIDMFNSFASTQMDKLVNVEMNGEELENLRKDTEKLVKEKQSLEELLTKEKEQCRVFSQEKTDLSKQTQLIEKELTQLKQANQSLQQEIERVKIQHKSQLKRDKQLHDKEVMTYKSQLQQLQQLQLIRKKEMENSYQQSFAVICAIEDSFLREIVQDIHPDVLLIPVDEWNAKKKLLTNSNLKSAYIQRNIISTDVYFDIDEYAKKQGLATHTFKPRTLRSLVDWIGHFKKVQEGMVHQ